jgi:hypothetical protein
MTIDKELITQVQQLADEACSHRLRTLIACYVGFIGLLESNPELLNRAIKLEKTLRTFRETGALPLLPVDLVAKSGPAGAPGRARSTYSKN